MIGGVLWRRANRWEALASLVAALSTNFALYRVTGQRMDYSDPNVILAALLVGIAALVIVSLLSAPEPHAAVASLFARLDASSDDGTDRPLVILLVAATTLLLAT